MSVVESVDHRTRTRPAVWDEEEEPILRAVRRRAPERTGLEDRFAASDPHPGWELTRNPRLSIPV
jgi:hypothetical protein